jgi:RNA recognition motif-containing protein
LTRHTRAIVMLDEVGKSRGYAFVTMSSLEEVDRAIAQLDQSVLAGREIKVRFFFVVFLVCCRRHNNSNFYYYYYYYYL